MKLRILKDLIKYKTLLHYLVILDLQLRYRSSFFGFLWTLLNPLLTMLVLWVVFSRLARVQESNYSLFLLSALMVWFFFQQSVERSLNIIIGNRELIINTHVPKAIFPVALVISNFVNLLLFLAVYIVLALPTAHGLPWTALLLPIALLMLLILSFGATLLMSAVTVFFHDFLHLTAVFLRILFYLTPILYSPKIFGPKLAYLIKFNPVYYPVQATRDLLYAGTIPSFLDFSIGFGMAVAIFIAGLVVFTSIEDRFVYYI
jgi:ABC-type polysaccharide/polyol phosphate export permease